MQSTAFHDEPMPMALNYTEAVVMHEQRGNGKRQTRLQANVLSTDQAANTF